MDFIKLKYTDEFEHIAILMLARPEVHHAFNTKMAQQLLSAFQEIQGSPRTRVVIITSTTEIAFCSGADLKERRGMSEEAWKEQHKLFEDMFQALAELKQPTIAAVNGYALAGGFELALNADIILAGYGTKFGLTEVTRGIMPGCGGSRLLPKRVPIHIAKEWLFTGRIISADEAAKVGLINKLVPSHEVVKEAIALAEVIAENAPLGVQGVKQVADRSTWPMEEARRLEIDVYNDVIQSQDRLEGVNAFNEKRKPIFKGL